MNINESDLYCRINEERGYGDTIHKVLQCNAGSGHSLVENTVTGEKMRIYTSHLHTDVHLRQRGTRERREAAMKIGQPKIKPGGKRG